MIALPCLGGSLYLFSEEGRDKMWFAAALGLSQDVPAVCCSADGGARSEVERAAS